MVLASLSVALALKAQGQSEEVSYTVALRSAHETVWQRVLWETNQLGRAVARTHQFVELASASNLTLRGDTTYYVSSSVSLSGTTRRRIRICL